MRGYGFIVSVGAGDERTVVAGDDSNRGVETELEACDSTVRFQNAWCTQLKVL